MFTDLVFPGNNEAEFISIAKRLGYDRICFVYDDLEKIKELQKKKEKKDINVIYGALVDYKSVNKAKEIADLVLVESSEKDRVVMEKEDEVIIFNFEINKKKDFMHQRASGLNQVMCKLAKRNDISIAFPFSTILNFENKRRAELIGRIMQNIRLCRKYKVKTIIASFAKGPYEMRTPQDLISFFTNIGMHAKEAKDSLSY